MRGNPSTDPAEAQVEIEWREGIMFLTYIGAFDGDDYTYLAFPQLQEHLQEEGKRTRMVTDLSRARAKSIRIVEAAVRGARHFAPYIEREAWVGLRSNAVSFLAERAIALSGREDIRIFKDVDTALRWIRED